jgi:hypothetical protein
VRREHLHRLSDLVRGAANAGAGPVQQANRERRARRRRPADAVKRFL